MCPAQPPSLRATSRAGSYGTYVTLDARTSEDERPLRGVATSRAVSDKSKSAKDETGGASWGLWARARDLGRTARALPAAPCGGSGAARPAAQRPRPEKPASLVARCRVERTRHPARAGPHPDGESWAYAWRSSTELRNPAGWITHRMRRWLDTAGAPLPCPMRTIDPLLRSAVPAQSSHQEPRPAPMFETLRPRPPAMRPGLRYPGAATPQRPMPARSTGRALSGRFRDLAHRQRGPVPETRPGSPGSGQ
jgi:hypothetical protein